MKTSCVLLVLLGVALPAALGYCPDGFTVLSGACLKVERNALPSTGSPTLSWNEARRKCQALGADLAVIDTQILVTHLSSHIKENVPEVFGWSIWIGGRKERGLWRWIGGKRITTTSSLWAPHQPSDDPEYEFVNMIPAGSDGLLYLSTAKKYGAIGYVCQVN